MVPTAFSGSAFINDFRHFREDEEYTHYKGGLLANSRLANVNLQQNEMYTENHLVDSSQVALEATWKLSVSEELYSHYRKTKFTNSLKVKIHLKTLPFYRKELKLFKSPVSSEGIECCV